MEIELKFRVSAPPQLRRKIRALGFHITRKKTIEVNWLFDDARGSLRRQGKLLRLRHAGPVWLLTAKGPKLKGPLKRRAEFQTVVQDGPACRALLALAGFHVTGTYSVVRTLLTRDAGAAPRQPFELAWDETAKGTYLEIEGTAGQVRSTARALGLDPADAEPLSYPELLCARKAVTPKAPPAAAPHYRQTD